MQHGFEKYLTKLNFLQRRALCKFRTGNHRLPVVESRYKNTALETTCSLCNAGEICDEFHVLFQCNFFEEKRNLFIKPYYYRKPSAMKMCSLFNSSPKQLSNLAKFTEHIMSKFQFRNFITPLHLESFIYLFGYNRSHFFTIYFVLPLYIIIACLYWDAL